MQNKMIRQLERVIYQWEGVHRKHDVWGQSYYIGLRSFVSVRNSFLIIMHATPAERAELEQRFAATRFELRGEPILTFMQVELTEATLPLLIPFIQRSYTYAQKWKGI